MTNYSSLTGLIITLGIASFLIARRAQAKKIKGGQAATGASMSLRVGAVQKMLPAELAYTRVVQMINKNQRELKPDEHLVVLGACSNGEPLVVGAIGFANPDIIVLSGKDGPGNETHVMIHFSRIHVTCKKTKAHPESKICTIGFRGECH